MSDETMARKAQLELQRRAGNYYGMQPADMGIAGVKAITFEDGSTLDWGWGGWALPWTLPTAALPMKEM